MTYVIVEACIGAKESSCVEVCPVDCIHPTPDEPDYEAVEQLFIDPENCIDCNSCVTACPVDACLADFELSADQASFLVKNAAYYPERLMHSSEELESADFAISIDGEPVTIPDLLPGFEEQSRLGVVLRDDFAAVGASTLLLATVTAFYDTQRARHPEGFFRYADYFLFHVGRIRGNHNELEVFPDHKEVVVPDDAEALLQAINDRGITHLVVPEGERRVAEFQPMTVNGARARIRSALLYSPSGRVKEADVEIKGHERVDYYVWATLEAAAWADELEADGVTDPGAIAWVRSRLGEVDDEIAQEILARREALKVDGRTVETFRRIAVDEALELLSPAQ